MRSLSNELLNELYASESSDPFIMLLTLGHESFGTVRLVNDNRDTISRGNTYYAFPMEVTLPSDDGESASEVDIKLDNVTRELIDELRSVTTPINVTVEMVLASNPDYVQISLEEFKLKNISYNSKTIQGKLYLDGFLNIAMTSEKYGPTNFPGLF